MWQGPRALKLGLHLAEVAQHTVRYKLRAIGMPWLSLRAVGLVQSGALFL